MGCRCLQGESRQIRLGRGTCVYRQGVGDGDIDIARAVERQRNTDWKPWHDGSHILE